MKTGANKCSMWWKEILSFKRSYYILPAKVCENEGIKKGNSEHTRNKKKPWPGFSGFMWSGRLMYQTIKETLFWTIYKELLTDW